MVCGPQKQSLKALYHNPNCVHAHKSLSHVYGLCDPMDRCPPGFSVHGISQQEYRSGFPFPPPGIFPTQGSNLRLLHWQVDSLPLHHLEANPIKFSDAIQHGASQVALLVKNPPANALDNKISS